MPTEPRSGEQSISGFIVLDATKVLLQQAERYQRLGAHGKYPEMVDSSLLALSRDVIAIADFLHVCRHKTFANDDDLKLVQLLIEKTKGIMKQFYAIIHVPDVAREIGMKDKTLEEVMTDSKKARKVVMPGHNFAASYILGDQQPRVFASASPVFAPGPVFYGTPSASPAPATGSHFHSPEGSFPFGSCVFHPQSTTHNTAGCRRGAGRGAGNRASNASGNSNNAAGGGNGNGGGGRSQQ